MPRVTVLMPSYNHEKYIAQAIQSVLDQTYQDFEIVITDDGSTDGTVNEIRKFKDPRIRLFTFKENQGAAVANLNNIAEAKGEYFAMLSSDDIFMPDKLEKQVNYLDDHPECWAVFSYAQIIDDDGNDFYDENHFYYNIFSQPNKTRFEWLNHFFFKGNCLCHPSVLARKECYTKIGKPDPRCAQSGDFNRWIRVCLKHDIYIIPENLVKFRIRSGEANASAGRPEAVKRWYWEYVRVLYNFLEINSTEDFIRIFPEISKYTYEIEEELIPFYVAKLAIMNEHTFPVHQCFAIDVLFKLLDDSKITKKISDKCNFRYADFINLTGNYDIFNLEKVHEVKEKERQIAENIAQIQRLMNSKSWRITSPFRKINNFFNKKLQ